MVSRCAQDDEAVHILLAHGLENMGHGCGEHIGFFSGAGTEGGKDSAVAAHGIDDSAEIGHVSLNNTQMRILRQPFGAAGESCDGVSLSQCLAKNQPAGPSSS